MPHRPTAPPRWCIALFALLAVQGAARADSVVVFNEIHYHPADTASEWIELHNQLAVDIDISDWSLAGGVSYAFAKGTTLPADGYLIVTEDPAVMAGALGPWTGRLNNAGETIELRDNSGRVMEKISYGTEGDWLCAVDGGGVTLAKRGANLDTSDPPSRQASRRYRHVERTRDIATEISPRRPDAMIQRFRNTSSSSRSNPNIKQLFQSHQCQPG